MSLQRGDGTLAVNTPVHVHKLIAACEEFGWDVSGNKKPTTPMHHKLVLPPAAAGLVNQTIHVFYRSVVASALWIAGQSRPDISYACSILARAVDPGPTPEHVSALVRVVRYLAGTTTLGIQFVKKNDRGAENQLVAYYDANYVDTTVPDGYSVTGLVLILNGGAILWRSAKQTNPAQSSGEAECNAGCEVSREVVYARQMLQEIGHAQHSPTTIYGDATVSISVLTNARSTARNKYFIHRVAFVKANVDSGVHTFEHVPSADNIADMLTKALDTELFLRHRASLMTG